VEGIKMGSHGSRYNEELKSDILRLIKQENKPINKVAKDFGINSQTIRNWLKSEDEKSDPENSRIAQLEAQLKDEKRKTADLQQTVDILKKSVAIFVQDNRK
jgi:transposase